MLIHDGLDPDEGFDLSVQTVGHQLELTIGGNKGDGAVIFKAGEPNTLVEVDMLHFDGLPSAVVSCPTVELDSIVQPKTKLRHTAQLALHLDRPVDFRSKQGTIGVHQQVDGFHHIEKHLILSVFDVFISPVHHIGQLWGEFLVFGKFLSFLCDVLLEDLGFGGLWVPKVHHLIQQFIDDDEVITDTLLLKLREILLKDVHNSVQEEDDHSCVGVSVCDSKEIQILVFDVNVGDSIFLQHGLDVGIFFLHQVVDEPLGRRHGNISTVVS
mmetsp:Transcript_27274/g.42442  ORF Transcript_27274/g.42442 Transcript_27274/m.42442 type:complete len:269 (-) Transcript_27274:93-899(-)